MPRTSRNRYWSSGSAIESATRGSWVRLANFWTAPDALNETVRSRVSEADLVAADAVLRAVFPEGDACQQVDERMPPLTGRGIQEIVQP
jgi:hypothetical protein